MSQKFIFVGPIDGLYHICYKVPTSSQYASYETCKDKGLAEKRSASLNSLAEMEERIAQTQEQK